MKNRLAHLLREWKPEVLQPDPAAHGRPESVRGGTALPPGVNMLMPVELCINRELLISLLTASIEEMARHNQQPSALSRHAMAELEAALQQQLAFRSWAREHPASYICIAMYPTTEVDTVEDLEDLGDL
jgi:hypothetical protein